MTEEAPKALHIVELRAENVKKLKAVRIRPDGNTVVVSGRNGQGKTSVLDSIMYALGGQSLIDARPIRDGETEAVVSLDLGEYIVERKWSASGSTVTITSPAGARYSSPQQFLNQRIGDLSFDPLHFAGLSDRLQRDALLDLVELPFDPEELAGRRLKAYEDRTAVGRRVKELQGQFAGMPAPEPELPEEEVSTAKVLEDLAAAEAQGRQNDQIVREYTETQRLVGARSQAVERAIANLERATEELAVAEGELRASQEQLAATQAQAEALPEVPEMESFRTLLAGAEDINRRVRAAHARQEVRSRLDAAEEEHHTLTTAIEALDQFKAESIAAAAMPVPGLGFDDDGVTYKGVPFSQCSGAEQLRVSLAIAMADKPEIRVIRITDGSLLDSTNMAIIEEMATAEDYQVWIERVDESGTVGVVIEDGEVVSG